MNFEESKLMKKEELTLTKNIHEKVCIDILGNGNCQTCQYGYSIFIDEYNKSKCLKCDQNNEKSKGSQIIRCTFKVNTQTQHVEVDSIKACQGGFLDLITGQCTENCGSGRYGKTILGKFGMIDENYCLNCDNSCLECKGMGHEKCTKCRNGFQLKKINGSKNFGQCVPLLESHQNQTMKENQRSANSQLTLQNQINNMIQSNEKSENVINHEELVATFKILQSLFKNNSNSEIKLVLQQVNDYFPLEQLENQNDSLLSNISIFGIEESSKVYVQLTFNKISQRSFFAELDTAYSNLRDSSLIESQQMSYLTLALKNTNDPNIYKDQEDFQLNESISKLSNRKQERNLSNTTSNDGQIITYSLENEVIEDLEFTAEGSLLYINEIDYDIKVIIQNCTIRSFKNCETDASSTSDTMTQGLISMNKAFSKNLQIIITDSIFEDIDLNCQSAAFINTPYTAQNLDIVIQNTTIKNIEVTDTAVIKLVFVGSLSLDIDSCTISDLEKTFVMFYYTSYDVDWYLSRNIIIQNSQITNFNAINYPSLVYSYYYYSTVQLVNNTFQCGDASPLNIYEQKDQMINENFVNNVKSTLFTYYYPTSVLMQDNIIKNCYNADYGAVTYNFYTENFTDINSQYYNISTNFGGVLVNYLSNCYIQNLTAKNILSRDGETIGNGGVFYFYLDPAYGESSVPHINVQGTIKVSHFFSVYGGFAYIDGPYIDFSIENAYIEAIDFQSNDSAAFMYYQSQNPLIFKNANIDHVICKGKGCLIYSNTSSSVLIKNISLYGYNESYTRRIQMGDFNYLISGFVPEHSVDDTQSYQFLGSAFYLDGMQTIISESNTFEMCRNAMNGSVFHIRNSEFYDTDSKYKNNAANRGGSIYAFQSKMVFTRTYFSGSSGFNGGTICTCLSKDVTFDNIIVADSYAYKKGGFMFSIDEIQFEQSIQYFGTRRLNENNDEELKINQEQMFHNEQFDEIEASERKRQLSQRADGETYKFQFINNCILENTTATSQGGFFFMRDAKVSIYILEGTKIRNIVTRKNGGGFMTSDSMKDLVIQDSFISRTLCVKGQQGGFAQIYSAGNIILHNNTIQNKDHSNATILDQVNPVFYDNTIDFGYADLEYFDINAEMFYIQGNSYVESYNNRYINNYIGNWAGVFFLTGSFNESFSTYTGNLGQDAGAIYCFGCSLNIQNVVFDGNQAVNSGGVISIRTVEQSVIMQNVTFLNSRAKQSGGVLNVIDVYDDGQETPSTAYILMTNIFVTNALSLNLGGFLYLSNNLLKRFEIKNIVTTNVTAQNGGQYIYAENLTDASFGKLSITDSNFECYQTSWETRTSYQQKPTIIKTSGFNLALDNVNIQNCLNLQNSAAMVISNADSLSIQNSKYLNLHSQFSGVYKIQNIYSTILNNNTYQQIECAEGGIISSSNYVRGLTIQKLTITNITVLDGNGGILSSVDNRTQSDSSSIGNYEFSMITINNVKVSGNGGLFYIKNEFIQRLSLFGFIANNISAYSGGILYIEKMKNELITYSRAYLPQDFTSRQFSNIFKKVTVQAEGVLIYSIAKDLMFDLPDIHMKCSETYSTNLYTLYEQSDAVRSVIYLKDNSNWMTLWTNLIENCQTSSQGGALTLINSNLYDIETTYKNIYGRNGGFMYSSNSYIEQYSSKFYNISSYEGGFVYSDRIFFAYLDDLKVYNVTAQNKGGMFFVIQTSQNLEEKQELYLISSMIDNVNTKYGGIIYSSSLNFNVTFELNQFENVIATVQGGIADIQQINYFNISQTIFRNFVSPRASFIFSQSQQLTLNIGNSEITCIYTSTSNAASYSNLESIFIIDNAQQLYLANNTLSNCNVSSDGGSIFTVKNTKIYDQNSIYKQNTGSYGGVIRAYYSYIYNSEVSYQKNSAKIGGVFYLSESSKMESYKCSYLKNHATSNAGVLFLSSAAIFSIDSARIIENSSDEDSSVFYVLGSKSDSDIKITNSIIADNVSVKNTITFMYSNLYINNTKFMNNLATQQSQNLFLGFSNVTINNCYFYQDKMSSFKGLEKNYGTFIYVILNANILITNSQFLNGAASMGGAVYISGDSSITFDLCKFQNNVATLNGGAIYAISYNLLNITRSQIIDNNAINNIGDDIYVSSTTNLLNIQNSTFTNTKAEQSISVQLSQIRFLSNKISNIGSINKTESGAAINCVNCNSILIENSTFRSMSSMIGGAVYIEESDSNKITTTSATNPRYLIQNSTFQNCSSLIGGCIFIDNAQQLVIRKTIFNVSRAYNYTLDELDSSKKSGSGGIIYHTCDDVTRKCSLDISDNNYFINGKADIQGGAIFWNSIEPIFSYSKSKFQSNTAGYYGDNVACFGQRLFVINQDQYLEQIEKINPSINSLKSLQSTSIIDTGTSLKLENQRSGGSLPKIYLAVKDKYGQIVGSNFDSKLLVYVNSTYNQNPKANIYPPVIEGTNQFTTYGGLIVISNIIFDGSPGYNYALIFQSDAIDESKLSNQQYLKTLNKSSLDLQLEINLRECLNGEQFTIAGKCIECENSYSLLKQASPGQCYECPDIKAVCPGGSKIYPRPGFWRKSNISTTIIQCLYKPACLGTLNDQQSPMGECQAGYQGILCADCEPGFSRTGDHKCSKCPDKTANSFRLIVIGIAVFLLLIFLVRSTLNSATQKNNITNIYMKILLNHFQLIMITATFDINWSEEIKDFFTETNSVATATSQIFSVDCFLDGREEFTDKNVIQTEYVPYSDYGTIRVFFLKLVMIGALPLILIMGCFIGWSLYKVFLRVQIDVLSRTISSVVISLFLAHPSIVQYMFNDFKCKDIEGEQRVYSDLEVTCWDVQHYIYSYFVALPSIIVWGLGIPFFALILLLRVRKNLDSIETRQKFGFLYRGYKQDFYFFEIIIMYRKVLIIFIAIFVKSAGVIAQALVAIVVLVIFLMINTHQQPFVNRGLNDLESFSLITSLITIYCGLFFIINKPKSWMDQNPDYVDSAVYLSDRIMKFFFALILISNIAFFIFWLYRMYYEVRDKFRKSFTQLYLGLCLCFNQKKLDKEIKEHLVFIHNENFKEQFYKLTQGIPELYLAGHLKLNKNSVERLKIYLHSDKILRAAGMKEEIDPDEMIRKLNRWQRVKSIKKRKVNSQDSFRTEVIDDPMQRSEQSQLSDYDRFNQILQLVNSGKFNRQQTYAQNSNQALEKNINKRFQSMKENQGRNNIQNSKEYLEILEQIAPGYFNGTNGGTQEDQLEQELKLQSLVKILKKNSSKIQDEGNGEDTSNHSHQSVKYQEPDDEDPNNTTQDFNNTFDKLVLNSSKKLIEANQRRQRFQVPRLQMSKIHGQDSTESYSTILKSQKSILNEKDKAILQLLDQDSQTKRLTSLFFVQPKVAKLTQQKKSKRQRQKLINQIPKGGLFQNKNIKYSDTLTQQPSDIEIDSESDQNEKIVKRQRNMVKAQRFYERQSQSNIQVISQGSSDQLSKYETKKFKQDSNSNIDNQNEIIPHSPQDNESKIAQLKDKIVARKSLIRDSESTVAKELTQMLLEEMAKKQLEQQDNNFQSDQLEDLQKQIQIVNDQESSNMSVSNIKANSGTHLSSFNKAQRQKLEQKDKALKLSDPIKEEDPQMNKLERLDSIYSQEQKEPQNLKKFTQQDETLQHQKSYIQSSMPFETKNSIHFDQSEQTPKDTSALQEQQPLNLDEEILDLEQVSQEINQLNDEIWNDNEIQQPKERNDNQESSNLPPILEEDSQLRSKLDRIRAKELSKLSDNIERIINASSKLQKEETQMLGSKLDNQFNDNLEDILEREIHSSKQSKFKIPSSSQNSKAESQDQQDYSHKSNRNFKLNFNQDFTQDQNSFDLKSPTDSFQDISYREKGSQFNVPSQLKVDKPKVVRNQNLLSRVGNDVVSQPQTSRFNSARSNQGLTGLTKRDFNQTLNNDNFISQPNQAPLINKLYEKSSQNLHDIKEDDRKQVKAYLLQDNSFKKELNKLTSKDKKSIKNTKSSKFL